MLDYDVSDRSGSRWMQRAPRPPDCAKRWLTFLRDHREAITVMDFFRCRLSPMACLLASSSSASIDSAFSTSTSSTSSWIVQQLREAFVYESAPMFLPFDHDAKYRFEVPAAIRSMNVSVVRTAIRSPWQNGVAEHLAGRCRRDLTGSSQLTSST